MEDNAIELMMEMEKWVVNRRPPPTAEEIAKTPELQQPQKAGSHLPVDKYVALITRDFPASPTRTQILELLRTLKNE